MPATTNLLALRQLALDRLTGAESVEEVVRLGGLVSGEPLPCPRYLRVAAGDDAGDDVDDVSLDYRTLVETWGWSLLSFQTIGSYQGDHLVLLSDIDDDARTSGLAGYGLARVPRYGFVVIGYGSCSGCDELESVTPWSTDEDGDWSGVLELSARLRASVVWRDGPPAMESYLEGRDAANSWYMSEEEAKTVIPEFLRILRIHAALYTPNEVSLSPEDPHLHPGQNRVELNRVDR